MVGLVDIAPATEAIAVQGSSVTLHGVSAQGSAYVLGRFPELRMMAGGRRVAEHHRRDRLRAWGGRTRTRKRRVRSLLANFGSAGRELSRHLKYIARAWLIHAFLSSSPTTPATQSVAA